MPLQGQPQTDMTLKPSGFAIFALVSGAIVAGQWDSIPEAVRQLVMLWVISDLALGSVLQGIGELSKGDGARLQPSVLRLLAGGSVAAGLVLLLPEATRFAAGLTIAAGVFFGLLAFITHYQDVGPALTGLQTAAAWTIGTLGMGGAPSPVLGLAVVAGLGTWGRLQHRISLSLSSLWVVRLAWATLALALIVARQPLLAALVVIAATADDLYRLTAETQRDLSRSLTWTWVGSWVLVAIAASYWVLAF